MAISRFSKLRFFPWKRSIRSNNPKRKPGPSVRIPRQANSGSSNFPSQSNVLGGFNGAVSPSVSKSPSTITPPWLLLRPTTYLYNFYSVAENKVVSVNNRSGIKDREQHDLENREIVGSSHGWLALYCPIQRESLFLYNPISGRQIELPPVHHLLPVQKIIMSHSPDEDDCIVMMSHGTHERLAFCSPSRAAAGEWTPIGDWIHALDDKALPRRYQDFVYSGKDKLFFCVTEFGDLEAWDLTDPSSPAMTPEDMKSDKENYPWGSAGGPKEQLLKKDCSSVKYLVVDERTGQLFLVRRFITDREYPEPDLKTSGPVPYRTVSFDVHKIDREKRELIHMDTCLDGLTMFVGRNHGLAISAAAAATGMMKNCIYFTDSDSKVYGEDIEQYGGHDNGVFNYETRTFSSCYYPAAANTLTKDIERIVPPPIWFTPVTPPPRVSPWLMLPPLRDWVHMFYSLGEDKIRCVDSSNIRIPEQKDVLFGCIQVVGSSHGWLAMQNMNMNNNNNNNNSLFLHNPITRGWINLPPVMDNLIPTLSSSRLFRPPLTDKLIPPKLNSTSSPKRVSKLILSANPDKQNCCAMMTYSPEERLAFCYPNHGSGARWTPIGDLYINFDDRRVARAYEDTVYSAAHNLFFCVTTYGDIEAWDLRHPNSPAMTPVVVSSDRSNYPWAARSEEELNVKKACYSKKFLVVDEKTGGLYLVRRFVKDRVAPDDWSHEYGRRRDFGYKTVGFDVHRIDREKWELKYMDGSLDGLAMFIGTNHSFAVCADESSELKPNSIYFTDVFSPLWSPYHGHDIGIFNYENGTVSPCYYPIDKDSIGTFNTFPIWFTPTQQ